MSDDNTAGEQQLDLFTEFAEPTPASVARKPAAQNSSLSSTSDSRTPSDAIFKDYTLLRSKRRSLSLAVKNLKLEVRAPMRAPKYWIEQVIEEKRDWINRQLETQRRQRGEILRIRDGAIVKINGVDAPLCFCAARDGQCTALGRLAKNNRRGKLYYDGDSFHFRFPLNSSHSDALGSATQHGDARHRDSSHCDNKISPNAAAIDHSQQSVASTEHLATELFINWLKREAGKLLAPEVARLARALAVEELQTGLRFRLTKSTWGHCTAAGMIQLNPSIVLAPPAVRDYVIVHELCHLRHRNHSKRFWALVERHYPNWRWADKWLDEEGHRLAIGSQF